MCVGENNAIQSVNYLNAQLTALYQNALECLRSHHNAHNLEDHFRKHYIRSLHKYNV